MLVAFDELTNTPVPCTFSGMPHPERFLAGRIPYNNIRVRPSKADSNVLERVTSNLRAPTVKSVTPYEVVALRNGLDSEIWKALDSCFAVGADPDPIMSLSFNELYEANTPLASLHLKAGRKVETTILAIDLNATDEQLKADFAKVLEGYRFEKYLAKAKKPGQADRSKYLVKLIENCVLPYIDITLLGEYYGNIPTDTAIYNLFFREPKIDDLKQKLNKGTRKYTDSFFSEKTRLDMQHEVFE